MLIVSRVLIVAAASAAMLSFGCDEKPKPTAAKPDDHGHGHEVGVGHTHDEKGHTAGHGGKVVELGSATAGGFALAAARDQGPIEAGGEAPIDVIVMPAAGGARPAAVRFWIGTENAKGSVKAKASVENAEQPNVWHTHTEIPSPLPAGAKLWVEVEPNGGTPATASFDLKP